LQSDPGDAIDAFQVTSVGNGNTQIVQMAVARID